MRSTARIAFRTLGALFGVLAVLFAVAAWRLSSGPLSIGFLSPYIEEAFRDDDLDYRIEFEDTVLVWADWSRAFEIRVTDMRVADANGTTLVQAPAASIGLNGAALLRGAVAPTSIEIIGLRLGLVRGPDGRIRLATGDGSDSESRDDGAADALMADLLDPPREDHPLARLERVSLREAALVLHDEASDLTWIAPRADLSLDLDDAGIVGHMSLDLQVRDVETSLEVQLFHHRESKMGSAAVGFSGLNPAQFAFIDPGLEGIAGIRVPLSGTLALDLAPGGILRDLVFDIAGGAGDVSMPDVFPAPVPVRRLAAAGSIDGTLSRLVLDSFVVETDRPSFSLDGAIWQNDAGIGVRGRFQARDLPLDSLADYWPEAFLANGRHWIVQNIADGVMTHIDADLDIEPGALEQGRYGATSAVGTFAFEDASVHYLRPLPAVTGIDGSARFTGESLDMTMGDGHLLGIVAPQATAVVTGIHEDVPRMSLTIEAEGPAADALALLDDPRLALVSRIGLQPKQVGGTVHTLFTVDLPLRVALEAEEIDLSAVARLRDARMKEIAGIVDMSEGMLRLGVDNSSLDLRGTARLEGMPATISWQEKFGGDAPSARRFDVSMTVAPEDRAALGFDLAPHVQGSFALDAGFNDPGGGGPPRATLLFDMMEARLEIPDLGWSKPAGEPGTMRVLADVPPEGAIRLTRIEAETGTLHAIGRATLARGLDHFQGDAPFAQGLDASLRVTPRGEQGLGLELAPYLQGSLVLDARLTDPGDGAPPHAALSFDMTEARLEIPDLYWSKPAGEAGTMHILAVFPSERPVELARVEVETETLHAIGHATLAHGSGTGREITIDSLRYGETDIAGRIETGDDATSVSVRGASLDARPYLGRLMEEGAAQSGRLVLDLDVERLVTADNRQLTDVRAHFETVSEDRHAGSMVGTLATGEPFHLTLEPQKGKRLVTVQSRDAGAVARAFNIYDNATGGDLLMEAVVHDDQPGAPVTGTVRIDNYRVINAPTLARLLSVASLTGIVDALQGEGIAFTRFELPFSIDGDVVTIRDARTSGLALGVNAEGTVDLETDRVDLCGTIVPAYTFNTLIDIVPVIGELLTGGAGEGLFAASYCVSGTTEAPAFKVNPLSVLAPGFLRGLFSFIEEGGSAAPE